MSEKTVKQILAERGYSRRQISRLNSSGRIYLNRERCRLTQAVGEADILEIREETAKPEILYEDDCLIIVNKPAGIPCHPSAEHPGDDMGTILLGYLGGDHRIRTAGRLDKQVSGIMIYAKDSQAAADLSSQREGGKLEKIYFAVCEGVPEKPSGIMEYRLGKEAGRKKQGISRQGKRCVTEYRVIHDLGTHALLEIHIRTGRTHQIRAGFAAAGHPLAGDRVYGGRSDLIKRPALHCGKAGFIHPRTRQPVSVECPLPPDMEKLLAAAGHNRT